MKNINVILEIYMVYSYKKSLSILLEFSNLWGCKVMIASTRKEISILRMPQKVFKKIFGTNPKKELVYAAPSNSGHFIRHLKVKKIETK